MDKANSEIQRELATNRRMTPEELLSSMKDVEQKPEELQKFIKDECFGVKIGKTDVVFVTLDHPENSPLDPESVNSLELIARAPNTKITVVEYFGHELAENARKFPVFGKIVRKIYDKDEIPKLKTAVSNRLAEVAKETGKPLAVADIANKGEYFINYTFPAAVFLSSLVSNNNFSPITMLYGSIWMLNRYHEHFSKKGHFDKDQINKYEQVLFDIEDARRVFVAQGISKLAEQYKNEKNRILVCYPKAHAMRIANYITNRDTSFRVSSRIKEKIYKLHPLMDMSLRQYRWKNTIANLRNNPSLATWQKISDERL